MNKLKLVFATYNKNKLKEVQAMLTNFEIVSLAEINCFEDIPETAETLEGNAILKANYITEKFGLNCFADDTGLEVEALNGEPGVFSARYAGEQRDANDNMNKLLNELQDKPNRNAQFKTVVALHLNNNLQTFTGICEGEIITNKKGDSGFGYDPIFKPNGYDQTFAEMDLSLKNKIGHRGKAVVELVGYLNNI